MGRKVGRVVGDLPQTNDLAYRLVRLPLWIGLEEYQDEVIDCVLSFFS